MSIQGSINQILGSAAAGAAAIKLGGTKKILNQERLKQAQAKTEIANLNVQRAKERLELQQAQATPLNRPKKAQDKVLQPQATQQFKNLQSQVGELTADLRQRLNKRRTDTNLASRADTLLEQRRQMKELGDLYIAGQLVAKQGTPEYEKLIKKLESK